MKHLILAEILLLFLATTFQSDSTGGWVQQSLPTGKPITDIYFADSLHGWLSVSSGQVYDSAKILATTDGGNTWVTQFAKDTLILNAIQFLNLNTGYCVGGFQKVLKTTNAGQNWSTINSPGTEYFTDLYFVNADTGWICDPYSFGGVFKTTNGGANWQPQMGASYLIKKLFFINKDTGWALSNEANSRLYQTTNGGLNWNFQHIFAVNPRGIFFISKDTGYTGGFKTIDGGYNWSPMTNYQGTQVYFVNGKTGWTGGGLAVMQKTVDGQNWFNQTVPAGGYLAIQFVDSLRGWSGGTNLIHTADGGGPFVGIHQISSEVPKDFVLSQNYPNPFNPGTVISYQLRVNGYVKLIIFDITGREIASLVNQKQNAGTYQVDFDGSNLPSGVYFYQLIIGDEQSAQAYKETKKMILVK